MTRPDRGRRRRPDRWLQHGVPRGLRRPQQLRDAARWTPPALQNAVRGYAIDRFLGFRWDAGDARFVADPASRSTRSSRATSTTPPRASPSTPARTSTRPTPTTVPATARASASRADGPAADPCRAQQATPCRARPGRAASTSTTRSPSWPPTPARRRPPAPAAGGHRGRARDHRRRPARPAAPVRLRLRDAGRRRRPDARLQRRQRLRPLPARRRRRPVRVPQSSYGDYGNAAQGVYCDDGGNVVANADGSRKIDRRRPLDTATITTARYRFRYDGRWLMTQINVSADGGATYGPDLVDRWKARAFAQDPGSETPCCGYEEEDTNWGGSSTLLGERVGPVRAIRETWGADSGTNVIRRETFYRDEMRQKTWLRVHVIPPLDGIYAQWDFNAGAVDTFYNPRNASTGVAIDGVNDEVFGNLDDPCNRALRRQHHRRASTRATARSTATLQALPASPTTSRVDIPTRRSIGPNAALGWSSGDRRATARSSTASRWTRRTHARRPGPGAAGGPLLPRRLLLRRRHRHRPGPEDQYLRSGDEPTDAPPTGPRAAAGRRPTATRTAATASSRGRSPPTACTSSPSPTPTTPARPCRSTRSPPSGGWSCCPAAATAPAGEQYGRGIEKPLVALPTSPLVSVNVG